MRADELLTKRGYFKSRTKAAEAIRRGLVETGGKNGLRAPAGSATRAEVATMLMRFVAGL